MQRSRAYARESQIREIGKATAFPDRTPPQVADYSIRKTYGRLLDMFENAFTRKNLLFTLAMYYPLAWYKGPDKEIDSFEENRQKQVVGLIRTNFLKRFESSVVSFEFSCERLLQKLLAFLEVHSETATEKKKLELWKLDNAEILGYARKHQLELWAQDADESEDEDIVPQEMLDDVEHLKREDYDVPAMIGETFRDLDQIVHFLREAQKFEPKDDDKLHAILTLYTRVTQKTLLISKTLGIEGKKLLTPEDDYEALKEFNHAYEGTRTAVENMHLEYQALLKAASVVRGPPSSWGASEASVSKGEGGHRTMRAASRSMRATFRLILRDGGFAASSG